MNLESSFCEFTDIENQAIELVNMDISTTIREKPYIYNTWLYPTKIRKSKSCPNKLLDKIHLVSDRRSSEIYTDSSINSETYDINRENSILNFFRVDKFEMVNKHLSIFLHVAIMISFEIFFYFNYIVYIERNEILKKLETYFREIKRIETNEEIIAIDFFVDTEEFQNFYAKLYADYIKSSEKQKENLQALMATACYIGIPFYIFFVGLMVYGICRRKKIKWSWLIYENILMFLCLGIFEYLFFTNIILNYDPLTDAEIKYYFVKGLIASEAS